jgi:hypothetical protein
MASPLREGGENYGTASERWRMRAQPEYGYLPGFAPVTMG